MKLARSGLVWSGLSPARTFIMLLQPATNLGIAGAQPLHHHQASLPVCQSDWKPRIQNRRREVKARNQFADDYDGWRGRLAAAAK